MSRSVCLHPKTLKGYFKNVFCMNMALSFNCRWLVLKDSYICYLRSNQEIADLMLFDQDFNEVRAGFSQTRVRHGLIIANTVR